MGESWAEHAKKAAAQNVIDRRTYLEHFAEHRDRDLALAHVGHGYNWLTRNWRKFPQFKSAIDALKAVKADPDTIRRYNGDWTGTFSSFRNTFLHRQSAWYHEQITTTIEHAQPGTVHLIITPPEHGKSSILEDYATYKFCIDPQYRILYGHSQIKQAQKALGIVKSRLDPGAAEFAVMHATFGPFFPERGMNLQGLPQVWTAGEFNIYKRTLGLERDFSMRALGMDSKVAGTRTDLLVIDDPQERNTLSQTAKIIETVRDDWFTRPGAFGVTVIAMNVVGDGDIAEELIRTETCDTVTIFKAHDEQYLELGPRPNVNGDLEPSPWLWPERYDEAAYMRLKKKAGPEGWARKYQQDWRPATTRSFTTEMVQKCANPKRSVLDPPPRHPTGIPAQLAVSLDPGFLVAAVNVAALEPTQFKVLDTIKLRNARTMTQIIDLLADRIFAFHKPPVAEVKVVTVETKGFQRSIITDDAFLELRNVIGFEVVHFDTDWKKNDEDYGITQMARSMERAEFDFPDSDPISRARFDGLYTELYNWRPSRGNKLEQDEIMAMWFNFVRWHNTIRIRSIQRPPSSESFGFKPLPMSPLVTNSDWRFGVALGRR